MFEAEDIFLVKERGVNCCKQLLMSEAFDIILTTIKGVWNFQKYLNT